MGRIVAGIHDRWSKNESEPPAASLHTGEVEELARRVLVLRQLDSRFAHVRLSGFTEESDGRRVIGQCRQAVHAVVSG